MTDGPSRNNSNAKVSEITEKQKASNRFDRAVDIPNMVVLIFK